MLNRTVSTTTKSFVSIFTTIFLKFNPWFSWAEISLFISNQLRNDGQACERYWTLSYDSHRCRLTATDARHPLHPNVLGHRVFERRNQIFGAHHFACNGITNSNGDRWRHPPSIFDNIKVMVKGRHFKNFRRGQTHFIRKRYQVRCG